MLSRLSSYVVSYHYSYFKPPHYPKGAVACCPVHCKIKVYQDSRSWRNTSILSDLALYLLFLCNGRKVFLLRTSPTVNIFITPQFLKHKCLFHTKPRLCHCADNTKKVDDSKALRYNVVSPRDPISSVCYVRNVVRFKEKDKIINECS